MTVDLRSDTLTKPRQRCEKPCLPVEVGDDVFGEDPTVNALEAKVASVLGMQAALYCASGTMCNQLAIATHCRPGDQMICYENAHVYLYEGGGAAANAGVTARRIAGNRGILSPEAVASQINVDDPHFPHTSLVCIENTVNKGGGACWSLQEIRRVHDLCSEKGLALHMDGARLFNAVVAKGYQPHEIGKWVDSVSICLSKGLGAPVGSVLAGRKDFIHHARRARKRFGGGMRQAGMIAAAGLYALEHHVDRLKEDHERAAILAQSLRSCAWVEKVVPAETNIVIVYPKQEVAEILSKLEENGVLAVPFGPDAIRFVVHLDVDDKMIEHVCQLLLTLA